MPGRIRALTGAQIVRALQRLGFLLTRVNGSHHMLQHADGRSVTVPVHGSKTLKRGTLRAILKNAGITDEQLRKAL